MGLLRVCPAAGSRGSLLSMVGTGKLKDLSSYSSTLALADRMKASAMASSRVSGHQDSSCWKHLENSGDPEGLQAETYMYPLVFLSGV